MATLADKLRALNIDEKQVTDTLKNKKVCESIEKCLAVAKVDALDKKRGNLFFAVATKITPSIEEYRQRLTEYVVAGKIANSNHLDYTIAFIDAAIKKDGELSTAALESSCGIGIVLSEAEVGAKVREFLNTKKDDILAARYTLVISEYLKSLREHLPSAEGKSLTVEFNAALLELLGPETE